jgi:hypothetical protein
MSPLPCTPRMAVDELSISRLNGLGGHGRRFNDLSGPVVTHNLLYPEESGDALLSKIVQLKAQAHDLSSVCEGLDAMVARYAKAIPNLSPMSTTDPNSHLN